MMRVRSFFCVFLLLSLGAAGHCAPTAATTPADYRFKIEVLSENMPQPMELEVAPDGRIFFNELGGKLKVYLPKTGKVEVVAELEVFTPQENGFLGFALDPNFAKNNWIYLFYSPKDYPGQRLSRFTVEGNKLDMQSEKRVLEFGEQRRDCCHHAGSVEFGPDRNLYISTGDNTSPGGDSAGYAPIDERPGREEHDAQKGPSNTHDLRGKILRIRPTPDGKYTIPSGNLFPKDGSRGRPEIYVMGCRNPWRMSVDSRTGFVYWGEVGPDAGGDGARGPRGYDELNQAKGPGNYGWPYFVGSNFAYADFDFETKTLGGRYDPKRPTNSSPNNTGSQVLPPAQPAFIYWPYGESKQFPMLGGGGRTACAGPVFYYQPEFEKSGGFPAYFDRCLLFYDWQRPFMKWARLGPNSELIGIEPFTSAVTVANERDAVAAAQGRGEFVLQRPVDSQFGPDGCLYLLDYGETWGANKDSRLLKISYQRGNIPPIAKAQVDRPAGREPLRVKLSSDGSKDLEGSKLSYDWRLHPGGQSFSIAPAPELTLEKPGNYVIELRVNDPEGGTNSATVPIIVGNTAPEVRFVEPETGDFFTPGKPVAYRLAIRDAEDGSSAEYEDLFEGRTTVNVQWSRSEDKLEQVEPGLALIKQSDCLNCHAVEQKIVGPPFLEIAERYRKETDAMETSVERVIRGSSGVWGDVPMLPHEAYNPDQVRMMVKWIFGLERGNNKNSISRGLAGEINAPKDDKLKIGLFEAVYTDGGRPPAGSLAGKATVKLRNRRLEAELADEKHGLKVLGKFVGAIDHGHYLRFRKVQLSESRTVTFRVASAGQGGRIELHSGSTQGPTLASVEVQATGGWDKWTEVTASLGAATNRADVVVVFANPGKGGLMNLDWLQFNP